ncbi:hypothetical protein Tco_0766471 [Tanacetum coccineum]
MSWFLRCSWYGGPFNSGNCRHCTNVSFGDEPVYDSNPNSYNQTSDFSNPLPHHNYETDSRSDTGAAFHAEFAKLQQNFEQFMAQQSFSYCGGPFNDGNCPSCSIGAGNEFVSEIEKISKEMKLQQLRADGILVTYNCELMRFKSYITIDDDNDEESTIPWNEIISQLPLSIAITTVSSVEDLVPIPNESEDTSESDSFASHTSFELNEDECFDPGGDEIEACLTSDSIPPGIDGADFDPEGDILLLEKLLNDDTSNPPS